MTPEIIKLIEDSDDVFGGVDGDLIDWTHPGENLFSAYGIKPEGKVPHVGQLLAAEFTEAWLQVEVKDITMDYPDEGYFLLEVAPVQRAIKPRMSAVRTPPRHFRFLRSQ